MEKIKIGIFIDNWYPAIDGVIVVVENLAKNLNRIADVTLVVPKMQSNDDENNYPFNVIKIDTVPVPTTVYRLALPKISYLKVKKQLENIDFDIIHIHSPFTIGKIGIKIAKEKNIPVIATMHTRWEFEFEKYLKSAKIANLCVKHLIKAYNNCTSCIALNKSLIKVYKDYGYKGDFEIINNGTDLEIVKDKKEVIESVNNLFRLKKDDIVFLFVGRIVSIKNIFFILDVLKLLKEKAFAFKMIYVGNGPDYSTLSQKVKEYNLENDVILAGKIMDRELLKSIYYRADLFLFPSLFDSSSLVQIEAASQETPTIFVEGSVTSATIENNVNGFTAKEDVGAFATRIEEIIGNKKLYFKVKKNAKKELAKSWKEISLETYNYYLKVIDEFKRCSNEEKKN